LYIILYGVHDENPKHRTKDPFENKTTSQKSMKYFEKMSSGDFTIIEIQWVHVPAAYKARLFITPYITVVQLFEFHRNNNILPFSWVNPIGYRIVTIQCIIVLFTIIVVRRFAEVSKGRQVHILACKIYCCINAHKPTVYVLYLKDFAHSNLWVLFMCVCARADIYLLL